MLYFNVFIFIFYEYLHFKFLTSQVVEFLLIYKKLVTLLRQR